MAGIAVQETTGYAEGVEHAVWHIVQTERDDLEIDARESAENFAEEELQEEWASEYVRGYGDAVAAARQAAEALEP